MCPWRGRCAHEGEDVAVKIWLFAEPEFDLWKGFPHAFWKVIFMMEAAKTVKRYSAFPKTITSNPKSHFVFGVLPIAHILLQGFWVWGLKDMNLCIRDVFFGGHSYQSLNLVFRWNFSLHSKNPWVQLVKNRWERFPAVPGSQRIVSFFSVVVYFYFSRCSPRKLWEMIQFDSYFSNGLVQPPTSFALGVSLISHWNDGRKIYIYLKVLGVDCCPANSQKKTWSVYFKGHCEEFDLINQIN